MNKVLNGKNIAIGIITLALGVFVVLGIGKVWAQQTTTVSGNVASFILNPEGKVDGAILDTGDQVTFGAETGEIVAANVAVGGALTATGHAGTKSDYGREFHAKTVQIGEQTITVVGRPHPPKDGLKGGKPHGPRPPKGNKPEPKDGEKSAPPMSEDAENMPPRSENAPEANAPQPETAKISGTVKFVLVNKDGKARGLILAGGEQLNLGKEVENANLSFDANTNVGAEGAAAKSQFGTFVKAKVLTVGNQTFAFGK